MEMLSNYLRDRPYSFEVQSVIAEDEIEERLALAEQVMVAIRGPASNCDNDGERERRQWTAFQLSVIMAMPLANLRRLPFSSEGQFDEMKRLVKICTSSSFKLCPQAGHFTS